MINAIFFGGTMSESQDALNSASQKDDEISLIDLLSVLLHYKKMIILTTLSVILIALILCIISLLLPSEKSFLPNEYTPEATMLINDSSSSQSSLSSAQDFHSAVPGHNIPSHFQVHYQPFHPSGTQLCHAQKY